MKNFLKQHWPAIIAVLALVLVLGFFSAGNIWDGQSKPTPVTQEDLDRLAATLTDPYSIKDGKIYYDDSLIEGVDVGTFEVLSNRSYSKDKNHVYLTTRVFEGADAATFEFCLEDECFARDKNSVFLNEEIIEGADPKTYRKLKDSSYGKDAQHVFVGTKQLPGADPATWEPVTFVSMGGDNELHTWDRPYSKDKDAVYYIHYEYDAVPVRTPNADPATFVAVKDESGGTIYFKDKNQVYHIENGVLEGSDPATFELLVNKYAYARDAKNAYYQNKRLPSADLATFKVLGDSYAKDKNYLYHEDKTIFDLRKGADPFEQAAKHLLEVTPKGDVTIDYIVNTYFDITLHYGNGGEYNIFYIGQEHYGDSDTFFEPFFKDLERSTFDLAHFVPFRLAFVAPDSPASKTDFTQPIGPGIGGEVVGRKLLDPETMLVYGMRGGQAHLGPASGCKGSNDSIDKFIFKKVNGEWKIWEITEGIDQWTTSESSLSEPCGEELNKDKVEKYRNP